VTVARRACNERCHSSANFRIRGGNGAPCRSSGRNQRVRRQYSPRVKTTNACRPPSVHRGAGLRAPTWGAAIDCREGGLEGVKLAKRLRSTVDQARWWARLADGACRARRIRRGVKLRTSQGDRPDRPHRDGRDRLNMLRSTRSEAQGGLFGKPGSTHVDRRREHREGLLVLLGARYGQNPRSCDVDARGLLPRGEIIEVGRGWPQAAQVRKRLSCSQPLLWGIRHAGIATEATLELVPRPECEFSASSRSTTNEGVRTAGAIARSVWATSPACAVDEWEAALPAPPTTRPHRSSPRWVGGGRVDVVRPRARRWNREAAALMEPGVARAAVLGRRNLAGRLAARHDATRPRSTGAAGTARWGRCAARRRGRALTIGADQGPRLEWHALVARYIERYEIFELGHVRRHQRAPTSPGEPTWSRSKLSGIWEAGVTTTTGLHG